MITIYHAADLHLGLKFSKKSDAVRSRLIRDRFDALKNIIDACEKTVINFNEDIPFIIFKSQKMENEIKLKEPLGIFSF